MVGLNEMIILGSLLGVVIVWFGLWPWVVAAFYRATTDAMLEDLSGIADGATADVRRALDAVTNDVHGMRESRDGILVLTAFIASAVLSGITASDVQKACPAAQPAIAAVNDPEIRRRIGHIHEAASNAYLMTMFFKSSFLMLGFVADISVHGFVLLARRIGHGMSRDGLLMRRWATELQPWAVEMCDAPALSPAR
jgi:hypothetical protein